MKYLMRKMILSATRKVYLRAVDFSTTECGTEVFGLFFFFTFFLSATFQLSRVFCDFSLKHHRNSS